MQVVPERIRTILDHPLHGRQFVLALSKAQSNSWAEILVGDKIVRILPLRGLVEAKPKGR